MLVVVCFICNCCCLITVSDMVLSPDSFACPTIVLVPKDKGNQFDSCDGYRPVSLPSVLSKAFEISLLDVINSLIVLEEQQFGFTEGKGCQKVLLLLDTVASYYICWW